MAYNPEKHHRQSIRLKGYDYAQAGLYFVTICTQNRECLFGDIINGKMILNEAGKIIFNAWLKISNRFINTQLHEFILMPNHFHAILEITAGATLVVAPKTVAPNKTVGDIIGAFKSITTVDYILYTWRKNIKLEII